MILAVFMHEDRFISGAAGVHGSGGRENETMKHHTRDRQKGFKATFHTALWETRACCLSFQRTLIPECEVKLKDYGVDLIASYSKIGGDL